MLYLFPNIIVLQSSHIPSVTIANNKFLPRKNQQKANLRWNFTKRISGIKVNQLKDQLKLEKRVRIHKYRLVVPSVFLESYIKLRFVVMFSW